MQENNLFFLLTVVVFFSKKWCLGQIGVRLFIVKGGYGVSVRC